MGTPQREKAHWLERYATAYHAWTSSTDVNGQVTFKRPLGFVETSFDFDGCYYGGRADMTATLTCEMQHSLSSKEFRRKVSLAWTNLRLRHVLLMSRCYDDQESGFRWFAIDVPKNLEEAVQDVEKNTIWVEEYYSEVDEHDMHDHALNVGRIIEPEKCMSKLHVLPLLQLPGGTYQLRFLVIMAHQISDGLSAYNWFKDFIRILNLPNPAIEDEIETALHLSILRGNLPPAQEDLYPPIFGNRARQRWIWAIVRVLRHVKKTLPPTFTNPLYRSTRLSQPLALQPTYSKLFSYKEDSLPPLSTGHISAALSPTASARLIALCRSTKVSIGAGCFTLVGLAMMSIYSSRHPHLLPSLAPAMTASFPLNPRAFFANPPAADSCMLAFSDGIVMPFLSPTLPIEERFRLVSRTANRELRIYQKRLKTIGKDEVSIGLDKNSPARLLAMGYLSQIERANLKLPAGRQFAFGNPQGALQASVGFGATCGVSSVGSLKGHFRPGEYDLNDKTSDFVADYRGLRMGVRARDGEFLVGVSTDSKERVWFGVSYDMNAIDRESAELWARTITSLLE